MNIRSILNEFNDSNSLNHKRNVMEKYKEHILLLNIFQKAYDKVKWSWGISLKNISYSNISKNYDLEYALKELEKFNNREYTGNLAKEKLTDLLSNIDEDSAHIIERIIDRDLKINFGKREYNKIVDEEHQCTRPPYMRCGIYSEKTAKNISFPAYLQIKADGMFQAVTVDSGNVTFTSRSGEEREFPTLEEEFKNLPSAVYVGELLVRDISNRQEANGMINSDDPPHDRIYMQLWDMISLEEYSDAKHKKNIPRETYYSRFYNLSSLYSGYKHMEIIDTHEVNNIQEALQLTSKFMNQGFEGAILKDKNMIFKDTTSNQQLKLKLEIELDVRVTGFTQGTKGTRREHTFGAIAFTNDEGTIVGQCSGVSDANLELFHQNRDQLIGKIMTVKCNDLTKARDKDAYALSHPRYLCFREDSNNETDTLERAMECRNLAMMLK